MTKTKLQHPQAQDKNEEPYTRVYNRVIRSTKLNVYDKCVYLCIASCNPSFPSYEKIAEWCGISRDRVWKSLRNLEKVTLIERYKNGRRIEYRDVMNSPPHGLMKGQPVRYTDSTSPYGGLITVRYTDSKKNKEKEHRKSEKEFEISGLEESEEESKEQIKIEDLDEGKRISLEELILLAKQRGGTSTEL